MSPYKIIALLFSFLFISTANGQNSHRLGTFTSLNTKQTGSVGFAIKYQWQFDSAFAFEGQYLTSGDIKIKTNSTNYLGEQSLLSIGAVFLKKYNPELNIKIASGANYVISSSSDLFIQQSSISPYLKLTLEYQLTDKLFLEAGQASYFQGDRLGNNHNFFIGINYLLSSSSENQSRSFTTSKSASLKPTPPIDAQPTELTVTAPSTNIINHPHDSFLIKNDKLTWVLQLGAYTDEINADQALIEFKLNPIFNQYHIVFFKGFYRVISPSFTSYDLAHKVSAELLQNNGVSNLIKQLN